MLLLGTPGWTELALIAFIILLLFGKNRLPGLARSIGTGIHEFKKGISGQFEDDEDQEPEQAPKAKQIPKKEKSTVSKSTGAKKTKTR